MGFGMNFGTYLIQMAKSVCYNIGNRAYRGLPCLPSIDFPCRVFHIAQQSVIQDVA